MNEVTDQHMLKKRLLYSCDTCSRVFQGLDQFNTHISSRLHKNMKKSQARKEKYIQYVASKLNSNEENKPEEGVGLPVVEVISGSCSDSDNRAI